MQQKTIFLIFLISISLNISCQTKKQTGDDKTVDPTNMKIDILKINFSTDLGKLLKTADFKVKESEFSEYIKAERTTNVNLFKLGDIELLSTYEINGVKIPNDSYISLSRQNGDSDLIETLHLRYNFIGDKDLIFNELKKLLGAAENLNNDESINALKEKENFIWRGIGDNRSLILSQFTDGSAIGVGDVDSRRINSVLIYIIDGKSEINYPNGQKEKIIERLENRFSR
ncbi:hypothetical protein B4Q04_14425 [Zobellia sp. OII3]|uniref:hypothetical protein n=1 Tax=Zobellia sp. OII3 TaxID=2034520 RepID=UPI000B532734|nr:hypothetical protein [Zobellia sp. OII3]OWW24509.1 hypothetical protein B4Q04_14425 [Zobellia sp. OII3]